MENELKDGLQVLVGKMEIHSSEISGEISEMEEKLNTLKELQGDAEDIIDRLSNLDVDVDEFISKMEEVMP